METEICLCATGPRKSPKLIHARRPVNESLVTILLNVKRRNMWRRLRKALSIDFELQMVYI